MTTDKSHISTVVREHLGRHPLDNIRIEVLDDLVRQDKDWWYVPVQPSERLPSISPYYELLARVEEELDADEGLNVLLVPALPRE